MARVVGSSGACAGLFTYLGNNNPNKVQEADIEILTAGPRNRVQYTNQPSTVNGKDIPQATVNGTNPGTQDWSDWNVYRMDWMPKRTSWYMNGHSVANISFQAPRDPSALILNMWSDGGVWSQNMTLFDEAFLQIQWIQLVYNTSGPYYGTNRRSDQHGSSGALEKRKGTPGCRAVCSIDEQVNSIGTPALLYNNTGSGSHTYGKEPGMSTLAWVPAVFAAGAVLGFL
jgi:beta-glucanase (GH16 family)